MMDFFSVKSARTAAFFVSDFPFSFLLADRTRQRKAKTGKEKKVAF